jgi:hypothetical protein
MFVADDIELSRIAEREIKFVEAYASAPPGKLYGAYSTGRRECRCKEFASAPRAPSFGKIIRQPVIKISE